MYKTGTGRRTLSCMFRQNDECNENGCRYCIKQYFADKAKGQNLNWIEHAPSKTWVGGPNLN